MVLPFVRGPYQDTTHFESHLTSLPAHGRVDFVRIHLTPGHIASARLLDPAACCIP